MEARNPAQSDPSFRQRERSLDVKEWNYIFELRFAAFGRLAITVVRVTQEFLLIPELNSQEV